jgi:hypothetical protein
VNRYNPFNQETTMATKHSNQERTTSMAQKTKPATTFTADVNKAALAKYAMQDRADFHDVDRGSSPVSETVSSATTAS